MRPCSGAGSRCTNICRNTITCSRASRSEAGNCQFVFLRHSGGPPVNELFEARLERAFAASGLKASDHCVFLTG